MFDKTIEDLIKEHLAFSHGETKGWNKVYCEVCGDGKRVKGPRGGWLFSDEMCFYHCFNCGIDGNFDPNREYPFSEDMRTILDAFNIPKIEYNAIAYGKKVFGDGKTRKPLEKPKSDYKILDIPDYFCELNKCNHNNVLVKKAFEELQYRNIEPDEYTFFLSTGKTKEGPKQEAIAKALMGRLIIPIYDHKGNFVYFQARNLDKTSKKKKYINAEVSRTGIMYGMDKLNKDHNHPLYITEGFFDAFHLKGVALLENNITKSQLDMLRKSKRKKIFVPDKKSDSSKVVDQFIKEGWYVSVPDIGSECKDIDDSIRKFGKLHTFYTVANSVFEAENGKIVMGLKGFL